MRAMEPRTLRLLGMSSLRQLITACFFVSTVLPFAAAFILSYSRPIECAIYASGEERKLVSLENGKAVIKSVSKQLVPIVPQFTDASLHGPRFQDTMRLVEVTKLRFSFPLWIAFGIPVAASGFLFARAERVRRRVRHKRCDRCGFSLIGNVSGRCPECGMDVIAGRAKTGARP